MRNFLDVHGYPVGELMTFYSASSTGIGRTTATPSGLIAYFRHGEHGGAYVFPKGTTREQADAQLPVLEAAFIFAVGGEG